MPAAVNFWIDMKKQLLTACIVLSFLSAGAQSATTQNLLKKFDDSFTLFFYKNTLRMFNQADNKEFDELVKNIEKMRFIIIDKDKTSFHPEDYTKLTQEYRRETYESIMTARYEGRNFDIYLKDRKGSTLGTVVLVNDSTNLYVLDILGSIDVSKASSLFSALEENSDVGKQIKSFMEDRGGGRKRDGTLHIE